MIDLVDPRTNNLAGTSCDGSNDNITGADFDALTDTAVTSCFPFVDNSCAGSRFLELDNLTISGRIAIPEPTSLVLIGLGCFGLLAKSPRRNRSPSNKRNQTPSARNAGPRGQYPRATPSLRDSVAPT